MTAVLTYQPVSFTTIIVLLMNHVYWMLYVVADTQVDQLPLHPPLAASLSITGSWPHSLRIQWLCKCYSRNRSCLNTQCASLIYHIFKHNKKTIQLKIAPIVIIDVLDSHFELTVYFTVLHNMLIGLQFMVLFYASLKLDWFVDGGNEK